MLSEVNFGVKPTDREFPESLASGIVRFASRRLKREIPPLPVNQDLSEEEEDLEEEDIEDEVIEPKRETAFDRLNRLAKLLLNKKKNLKRKTIRSFRNISRREIDKGNTSDFRKIEVSPEEASATRKRREEEMQKRKKIASKKLLRKGNGAT